MLAGCLSLGIITAASYADDRIRWTPDPERGSIGSTLSGGRRGQETASCQIENYTTQLSLLVPGGDQTRLLTTKATPTLGWHVTTEMPISMTLYVADPTSPEPIYTQTIDIDKTATVSVTLPDAHSLEANKQYRWTVFVACPDGNSEIFARSFVERVNRESLNVDSLPIVDQASVYANHGIWYDAMAALLTAGGQGVTDAEAMVHTLLEQGQSQAHVSLSSVVHH